MMARRLDYSLDVHSLTIYTIQKPKNWDFRPRHHWNRLEFWEESRKAEKTYSHLVTSGLGFMPQNFFVFIELVLNKHLVTTGVKILETLKYLE